MEEKAACQQYLAGIANLILGMTMYYSQNCEFDNKATEQISKAKVFIRENLLKGIGPEEVADSLHMSYSWFRKLFKEYTGLSPAHYIQELKIQQAKDLLATTQRSTKEIAYYLTFDDIPYFTKVFKKYTGYTPQSYRKNSEENKKQPPSALKNHSPQAEGGYFVLYRCIAGNYFTTNGKFPTTIPPYTFHSDTTRLLCPLLQLGVYNRFQLRYPLKQQANKASHWYSPEL